MNKRILICLLALGLGLQQTGCTSSSSMDESDVAQANDDTFAEESEGDFEEELAENSEPVEGEEAEAGLTEEGTEVAENTEGEASGDDLSLDEGEELSLDEGEEDGEGTEVASNSEGEASGGDAGTEGDELSLDDPESLPEEVASSEPLEGDLGGGAQEPPMAAANEPPPSDEPLFTPEAASSEGSEVASNGDGGSGGESFTESAAAAPAASFIPVKKIRDAAFTKAGANLNRVYIARPGDTVKGASKKIYGTNRSDDILLWNGHLQRGMKTGDKLYYTSPTNPQDSRMLTYYEDVNANPSTYVSKEGDNIRTVSKDLLGFSGAWKEVWATNFNVESKGDIPAGTELKYWSDSSVSTPLANNGAGQDTMGGSQPEMPPMDMAQNSPDGMQDPGFGAGGPGAPPPLPPGGDMGAPPPMPPSDFAANGAPPPMDPPMDASGGAMAGVDPLAPPPPPAPPVEAAPPPEPRPVAKRPPMDEVSESAMGDPDTVMMMGFAGILIIAAAVLFVVIRKNRSKRMDLGQTQV